MNEHEVKWCIIKRKLEDWLRNKSKVNFGSWSKLGQLFDPKSIVDQKVNYCKRVDISTCFPFCNAHSCICNEF